jgi:CTP:molybdopterin cytidylyltransferase MocA
MQTFAVIPAAGRSLRMGQPKLLLPWRGSTVLENVLKTWSASRVGRVVLVVHPDDAEILRLGAAAGAHVVQPQTPPEEMKVSVQLALDYISHFEPTETDAWLLAPADMPTLATALKWRRSAPMRGSTRSYPGTTWPMSKQPPTESSTISTRQRNTSGCGLSTVNKSAYID